MPETVADIIARADRMQQEHLEWCERVRREEMEHEQRMQIAIMRAEQRADAARNAMYLALNPNISGADFDRLLRHMLAP